MLHVDYAIIVEGKYDKMRVERVCDAPVFTTEGFRIFKSEEKRDFLRLLAKKRGILILTDSDRAGFLIRNHIKGTIREGTIINAYIPEVFGKERRKKAASAEGKLGVEGMEDSVLTEVLKKYTAPKRAGRRITKADLFDTGLYGGANSAAERINLCKRLCVPSHISPTAFLDALNALYTAEEYYELVGIKCTNNTD